MKMPSVMKHNFARIPRTEINRSKFDRSHGLKTAFDSGYLVPVEVQEVLPGDEVEYDIASLMRMAPVVTCPMDNVFLDFQAFFVPNRLIWTNFVKMMGERVNPKDSIDYQVPVINSGESGFAVGSLADYFGIPPNVPNLDVSCLPFRAYAKIFDDWYRDEGLQDSIIQSTDDLGDSNGTIVWNTLLRRGKRSDYFTRALTAPQRGVGVELPLGTTAPVMGNGMALGLTNGTVSAGVTISDYQSATLQYLDAGALGKDVGTAGFTGAHATGLLPAKAAGVVTDATKSGLVADLTGATAATINSLRLAFAVQRILEKDARQGVRYCEILRGHFLTVSPDARLQRSEYLGGSSELVNFNPVLQTSGTVDGGTPQANLTANPKAVGRLRFKKAFTEHGWLMILANVRADLNYQQGLNRMFSRRTRYDFFWPSLQNLGESAVKNKEIFCQGKSVLDDDGNIVDEMPFGYQEAWAEYRYAPSVITGKMRSGVTGSLDIWHLAQHFQTLPTLSAEWIQDTPPLDRIIAVEGEPQCFMDCYFKCNWTRPMATFSVPGLIDHL